MKIVRIDWHDARSIDGWVEFKELNESLTLISSVGYLIKANKHAYYVAACAEVDTVDPMYSCIIVIPKNMVQYFETIKEN